MSEGSAIEQMLRAARASQPDLWKRTEQVARIIDPAAFEDGWIVDPPRAAELHAARLGLMRATAMRKAQDVLTYLGVNTEADWYDILRRLADGYCDRCGGEGWILTCCDDICHGVGYCIHGDGMEICSCNVGGTFPSNAPADWKVPR